MEKRFLLSVKVLLKIYLWKAKGFDIYYQKNVVICIFLYKSKIYDSVLIQENNGHRNNCLLFSVTHIRRYSFSKLYQVFSKPLIVFLFFMPVFHRARNLFRNSNLVGSCLIPNTLCFDEVVFPTFLSEV